MFVGT